MQGSTGRLLNGLAWLGSLGLTLRLQPPNLLGGSLTALLPQLHMSVALTSPTWCNGKIQVFAYPAGRAGSATRASARIVRPIRREGVE